MTSIKLEWTTVSRKVNDLIPKDINPRKITGVQMTNLKKSLKKYNLVEIPAIGADGKIIAGHQRIKALQLLGRGDDMIDVRIPNRALTDDETKQYLIGSNAIDGEWDYEALKSFEIDLLVEAGLDRIEIGEFWDDESDVKEDNVDVEQEIKEITEPTTKLGDIILLGKHKVICGDSTKQKTLVDLFGTEQASMIYSDPVYNISINYDGGFGGEKGYGGNVNDTRSFDEYMKFISDSLESALTVSKDNIHVFYWCDQIYIGLIQEVYRRLGLSNKRVCLWLKNNQNPVPLVAFNKVYEPVVYAVKGVPYLADQITNLNEVLNKEFTTGNKLLEEVEAFIDVWCAKRLPSKEYEHATSKPITLHEKAIKRCTAPGDIILDSFLGSGSTLLAAEQLGRRVYGCELEPAFCDLIIRRYELLTKDKAKVIRVNEEI